MVVTVVTVYVLLDAVVSSLSLWRNIWLVSERVMKVSSQSHRCDNLYCYDRYGRGDCTKSMYHVVLGMVPPIMIMTMDGHKVISLKRQICKVLLVTG